MIKTCKKCGNEFNDVYFYNGKKKKRDNRKYCYVCHPFRNILYKSMAKCEKCGENFEKYPIIKNRRVNLSRRKLCTKCLPFISRNSSPKNKTGQHKICKTCGREFKITQIINGDKKQLKNRTRCLECSPFNKAFKNDDILNYKLNDIQKQILEGHLLGDGCLIKNKNCKDGNANFHIYRMAEDEKYLRWTASYFKDLLSDKAIGYRILFDKSYNNKERHAIKFNTRHCPSFTEYYNKWYPEGKKIIPKDLVLTPLMIAIWIADDGCIQKTHNTRKYSDSFQLTLSTQSFEYDDLVFLRDQLIKLYGDKIRIGKSGTSKSLKDQFIIFCSHTATVCNIISDLLEYFPPMDRKLEKIKKCKSFKLKETNRNETNHC